MVVLDNLRPDNFARANQSHTEVECSCVGLKPGQPYTTRQLLEALLMVSGNDAANMLADMLGGQRVAVAAMNRKAVSVGARGTTASSPSGLDGPGWESVTTPHDLAVIFRAALSYPLIAHIMRQPSAQFPGKTIANQNELLKRYPGTLGRQDRFHEPGPQHLRRRGAARRQAACRRADVWHRRHLRPGDRPARLGLQPVALEGAAAQDHQVRVVDDGGAPSGVVGVTDQVGRRPVLQSGSAQPRPARPSSPRPAPRSGSSRCL